MRRHFWIVLLLAAVGCGSSEDETTGDNSESVEQSTDAGAAADPQTESGAGGNALVEQLLATARAHMQRGQGPAAIEALSQAIGLDPENAAAYALRSDVYQALREDANALADLSTAIRLSPEDARLHNTRGFFFMTRNQLDRAFADFTQAITLDGELAQAYNNRGLVHVARRDFDKAVTDFNRALEISADYIDALNNRGYAQSQLGKPDAAIRDFDEVIRLQPAYHNAYNNRGLLHFNQERFEAAVADFSEAIKLQPLEAKYRQHRREALTALKRFEEAAADETRLEWLAGLATLSARIRRAPGDAELRAARGAYLLSGGEQQAALDDYNRAIQLDERNPRWYIERAKAWMELELFRNAVNDATHALTLGELPAAHSIRGDALLKLGEREEALADFEAAKRIDHTVAEAYLEHSRELKTQGRDADAEQALQQALRLDPTLKTRQ